MPAASARRPTGLTLLSVFFAAGTIPSTATAVALAWPGAWSEQMWRLKPEAPSDFASLGPAAIPLMLLVALACGAAAAGLWTRQRWGYWTAVGLLTLNLIGDALNAILRSDWRTLIGVPIGAAILAYLLSRPIQDWFSLAPLS